MSNIKSTVKICVTTLMLSAVNVHAVADNFDYFKECLVFGGIATPESSTKNQVQPSSINDSLNIQNFELDDIKSTKPKTAFDEDSNANIGINFETSSEDSRAAISYKRASTNKNSSLQLFNISLSAPVAKSGDTVISRLGSFSSDAQVKLSMSKFSKIWRYTKLSKPQITAIQENVLADMKSKIQEKCGADEKCAEEVNKLVPKDLKVNPFCVKKHLGEAAAKNVSEYTPIASSFIGGSVAVGYKSFDFTDPADSSDQTKDKTPWSAEAFVGRYSADRKRIYRAGYKYVKDFKAEDEVLICQPPEMDGTQKCENKRFAGPKDDNQNVVFMETRQLLDKLFLKAVTAKLSFDFEDDELELDVPLYLYSDAESNLNGGIRLGWKQDKAAGKSDDFIFGIFVGSTFEISR